MLASMSYRPQKILSFSLSLCLTETRLVLLFAILLTASLDSFNSERRILQWTVYNLEPLGGFTSFRALSA